MSFKVSELWSRSLCEEDEAMVCRQPEHARILQSAYLWQSVCVSAQLRLLDYAKRCKVQQTHPRAKKCKG